MAITNTEEIIYKKVFPYNQKSEDLIIEKIKKSKTRQKQKVEYINIPAAFDIETSLIYDGVDYYSTMYIWQFGIGVDNENIIIYGRTWEEFEKLMQRVSYMCQLSNEKVLVIYVHNLSYEFSFIGRRFAWKNVFAMSAHKPLFARTENGIEFRCSYLLSGLSLNKVGEGLTKYKARKRTGDLDYKKIRGPETPLNRKELGYCVDDIHVLLNYIRETIEADGAITKIPYTKTGYARIHTRRFCFGSSHKKGKGYRKYEAYHEYLKDLTLDEWEYEQSKKCFTGGYSHPAWSHVDKILYNLGAMDISSSYPFQLCANGMPVSKPTLIMSISKENQEEFKNHLKNHCCIFYMWLYDLKPKFVYENLLSASKIQKGENTIENNGRIVSMDSGIVCMTEIDYELMKKVYTWDEERSFIFGFRWMEKGYLPKDFILSILTLYRNKTVLKGIKEKYAFYMRQKSILNSVYGMCVTSPVKEMILYVAGEMEASWDPDESKTEEELLEKYNNDKKRFSYYYWGIWCCKYAMKMVWDAILYLGPDYVYTDTDSVKFLNPDKHIAFFEEYNKRSYKKLQIMCDYYNIPYGMIAPENSKGEKCVLGAWDDEGRYKIFKTLGTKRYIYMDESGEVTMTTAGVRKSAVNYLIKTYGRYGIFEHFNSDLIIPAEESGKATAYYTDFDYSGDAVDYLGNQFHYEEKSGVAIVNTEYNMHRGEKYKDFLLHKHKYIHGI